MGQKVSPIGMRVGVIRDWDSRWYAEKEYGNLLMEDVKVRKFLEKELHNAYVSRIEIERTSNELKLIIRAARPGVLVGKNEKDEDKMESLKKKLSKLTNGKDIKLDVIEVANPDLDAYLVARKIAEQLEGRQSFRTTQKKAIQQTMRSGAKGIKTLVSGRLGGADIARGEGYSEGVVPLHTLRSDIDYCWYEANTTYGKLGVKVWICRGQVLPGQMVKEPEAPKTPQGRGPRRPRNNDRRAPRNAEAKAPAAASANGEATKGGN
jgi:small subunit ribosomal protein S3